MVLLRRSVSVIQPTLVDINGVDEIIFPGAGRDVQTLECL